MHMDGIEAHQHGAVWGTSLSRGSGCPTDLSILQMERRIHLSAWQRGTWRMDLIHVTFDSAAEHFQPSAGHFLLLADCTCSSFFIPCQRRWLRSHQLFPLPHIHAKNTNKMITKSELKNHTELWHRDSLWTTKHRSPFLYAGSNTLT